MANEIAYAIQMRLANVVSGLSDTYSASGLKADQAVALLVRNVQTISTGAGGDVLDLGSVVTPGMAVFVNLDAANYVEVGIQLTGTFYPFLKLNFGEQAGPMRLGVAAPYARANTLAVKLFYIVYNN